MGTSTAVAFSIILALAAAERRPQDAAPAPVPPEPPTATDTRLDVLEQQPERYLGLAVTIYGEVQEVLSPGAFRIDEPNWIDLDPELVVVCEGGICDRVRENDRVTITAIVTRASDVARHGSWRQASAEAPVLVATSLVNHSDEHAPR